MIYALIPLTGYKTSDNPIVLDDYSSGSYALYQAHNPSRKEFIYFIPDEERLGEPRCDYILMSAADIQFTTRFIELKGEDLPRSRRCCRAEWDHAFHQLACTYQEFEKYKSSGNEGVIFILCTSIEKKRVMARFKNYRWYKYIRENYNGEIYVLYRDDYDTV
ncbi:MAG: hypothetical protein LBS19_17020 [Clostridiales bacterium]|jgi:hypothetical protein|nr:hypothetical protein [Clostridiales bacterium]